jgi:NADPH:quinone reductase-like Zn-dependent oxidoreductase
MRAVTVTGLGGPEVLQLVEMPDPVAGDGQVLVRVRAACVQPADLGARTGMIPGGPVPPPFLPGWDFAGEVVAAGAGVADLAAGDRVVGMVPWYLTRGTPGAYAEYVAADADWVVALPDGLDFAAAATVPLNALSASRVLAVAGLTEPTTVLVIGASGGVGGFLAGLAGAAGHHVIGVATGGDEDWVRGLGVAEVVSRETDLATVGPVPVVLDVVPVGAPAHPAVADGGILLTTRMTEPIDPARGVRQELVLVVPERELLRELVAQVAAGELRTRVGATLPLAEAAQAHRLAEGHGVRGKIVLLP